MQPFYIRALLILFLFKYRKMMEQLEDSASISNISFFISNQIICIINKGPKEIKINDSTIIKHN